MRKAAWRSPVRTAGTLFFVALLSLVTVSAALAYDPTGQPPGITEEADKMHTLYIIVTAMGLAVFVAVEAALVFMLFRFRKKSDELPPQVHGNNALEVVWTAIPVVIVIALFVASFVVLVDIEDEADDEDLTVHVQGFQFSWQFTYCANDDGNGTDADDHAEEDAYQGPCATEGDEFSVIGKAGEENEPTAVIPVGEPVEFALGSDDVIHSFYVRDFLYKLDVIPGRDNRFKVRANETGTFEGQCAELCGIDHSLMRFKIEVKTREDFDKWVGEQRAAQNAARAR